MVKNPRHDYCWYLPGKKKPFLGTTNHIAEVLKFAAYEGTVIQGGQTVRQVRDKFKRLNEDFNSTHDEEIFTVLDTYIANGYGDTLLRELIHSEVPV